MKFLKFFQLLWVIFALLDPDPDSEYGSGSTDLIESGSSPDPDPKPCFNWDQSCQFFHLFGEQKKELKRQIASGIINNVTGTLYDVHDVWLIECRTRNTLQCWCEFASDTDCRDEKFKKTVPWYCSFKSDIIMVFSIVFIIMPSERLKVKSKTVSLKKLFFMRPVPVPVSKLKNSRGSKGFRYGWRIT